MTPKSLATSTAGSPSLASIINGGILRRAAFFALLIGAVLTLTNQSAAIFGAEEFEYLPLALVHITPFVVVAISQVLGVRRAMIEARRNSGERLGEERVLATALGHGIPSRTVLVGLLAGSANASIVVTAAVFEGAGLDSLPVALLAQAYALPILFGLLSQTIAYRRAIQKFKLGRVAATGSAGGTTFPHSTGRQRS